MIVVRESAAAFKGWLAKTSLSALGRTIGVGRPSQAVVKSPRPTTAWESRSTTYLRHSANVLQFSKDLFLKTETKAIGTR